MCHNGNLLSKSNVILNEVKKQRSTKSISCASAKMKANFYFDTASLLSPI